ncbi:hypothetical protein ACJJTC_002200 [Scirpophaga incertulas]
MNIILYTSLSFIVALNILCQSEFMDFSVRNHFKITNKMTRNNSTKEKINCLLNCESSYRRMKRDDGESDNVDAKKADEAKNISELNNISSIDKHALLVANFKRLWPVERWSENGFFHEDYLNLINEHWLQFPPPSKSLQITLGGLYLIFATIGCWGNAVVLFMYFRKRIRLELPNPSVQNFDNIQQREDLSDEDSTLCCSR